MFHAGIVCKSVDPQRGGHERYINRLIQGLLERNHRIRVFTRDASKSSFGNEVEVVKIPSVSLGGGIRRWTHNYFARRIVERHREDLDFVLTTGKVDFGDVYRAGGGVHRRYLQECGSALDRWLPKNIIACRIQERLYAEHIPRRIIVNSRMVRNEIVEAYGTPEDRIEVVYNGVDTDRFHWKKNQSDREEMRQQWEVNKDDFLCLIAGGSPERKGIPELLCALGRLDDPAVKLLIAGNIQKRKIRRWSRKQGVEDRVIAGGYIEQMEQAYAAADLFTFPSRYDPGASVVIEALASGLPVITTRTNGTHELVDHGENGFVINSAANHQQMADHIQTLKNSSPEVYRAYRQNAFETGQRYSMDNHLESFLDAIQPILLHRQG